MNIPSLYDIEDIEKVLDEGGTPRDMFRVQVAKPDNYRPHFFHWMTGILANHNNTVLRDLLIKWFELYFRFYRLYVNDDLEV